MAAVGRHSSLTAYTVSANHKRQPNSFASIDDGSLDENDQETNELTNKENDVTDEGKMLMVDSGIDELLQRAEENQE